MKRTNRVLVGDSYIAEGRQKFRTYGTFAEGYGIDICRPHIVSVVVDVHTARSVGNCNRCPYFDDLEVMGCTLRKWFIDEAGLI